jgi:beta-N-acetylhexosaminidase
VVQLIDQAEVGGLIISSGTPLDVAAKLNLLQRRSRLPLLVSADLETGAGFRLRGAAYVPGGVDLGGATRLPSLMALGAVGDRFLAYEAGRITAEEARAVGIHVPFAPVLDVNNNAENPIINTRSFGEDPAIVAALGACLLRGIQDYGAIATGKHFPGHGNTSTDSHLSLPVIRLGLEDLERTELVPFREAIGAGIGAIMTAHIALPELTGDPRLPATLSPRVLTGLLREEMGFGGLVFTDAMDMEAIGRFFSREEAAALAVEAGADVLLMPPDPDAAIRGVMNAVLSGRIPVARIDESVTRILAVKAALDLHVERTVDLESVLRRVGIPEHVAVAQEVADRSLTLLRNRGNLLPLAGTPSADVLSITYRRPSDLLAGRALDARLRQTYARLQTVTLGPDTSRDEYLRVLQRARSTDLIVVSLHITAVSYQGTVAAPPELVQFLREIAGSGRPHVVISFGNPYLLGEFPAVQAYLLTWGGGEVSERAAARGLFGDVPVEGRAPTRIPPEFEIGDGIQLLARSGAPFPSRGTCG